MGFDQEHERGRREELGDVVTGLPAAAQMAKGLSRCPGDLEPAHYGAGAVRHAIYQMPLQNQPVPLMLLQNVYDPSCWHSLSVLK